MTVALNPDLKTVASGFCKSEQCHIQAETVAQKYNIRRIFLATDDPDVVYEASKPTREHRSLDSADAHEEGHLVCE